eukprot:6178528-Pleurochrysis_carterae.AAC.1
MEAVLNCAVRSSRVNEAWRRSTGVQRPDVRTTRACEGRRTCRTKLTECICVDTANSCAHAFAVAAATSSATAILFEDTRATSKATTVEATTAAKTVTSDAVGASSERLRRAAAETGITKVQIEMAFEGSASAK